MIKLFDTLSAAQTARKEMPTVVRGFATMNHIRKTLDGKFAVISLPASCYLSQETLSRHKLPASTFGLFDEGEPVD